MSKAELFIPQPERLGSREACGITAIFSKGGKILSPDTIYMQEKLQHRGRDSAGLAVFVKGQIITHKGLGKVSEVFPEGFDFEGHNLLGNRAIGHNRYGTSGGVEKDNMAGAQPAIMEWNGRKIAIAYNGNLPETERQKLIERIPSGMQKGAYDTLDIAQAIVTADGDTWGERIKNGLEGIKGAYSLTILTDTGEVFGLRGPSGTWPLWAGETDDRIIFASETRVDESPNIKWIEVKPGELVKATQNGISRKIIYNSSMTSPCILHHAYGAKQDSQMTENNTYKDFRIRLGKYLAMEHPVETDFYVGVPQTGLPIADGYASQLRKCSTSLIEANGDRSFIARSVKETIALIDGKYRIREDYRVNGKKIALLDDSLIRGKTMEGVIRLIRDRGASEVHVLTVLSKFVEGCDMGYYINRENLVALLKEEDGSYKELDEKEISARIGADSVHFLSIKGVKSAYGSFLDNRGSPCMRCMGQPHPLLTLTKEVVQ